MNPWTAVCLGIAAWFFAAHVKGRGSDTKAFGRFIVFLVALGLAAYWRTP